MASREPNESGSLVGRCLRVLELLAEDAASLPLGEIAARLGLIKSGCHRLLGLMEQAGWIEQEKSTGQYRLTLRLAVVGQRFFVATQIPDIVKPVLDRLAGQTHALARLAIVDGDRMTWISSSQGAITGLLYQPRPVARLAVHANAAGKCWLASLTREQMVEIVIRSGLGAPGELGPNAIHDLDRLVAELVRVRDRGWAMNDEEVERGVRALAAPVRGTRGEVVASVALAGPALHLADERIAGLVELTVAAANDISTLWPLRALRVDRASPA